MDLTVTFSDLVAIAALALSGFAVWTTSKFNKRQLSLIESQEALNQRLLEKGEIEELESLKAAVSAKLIKMGNSKYRLRVFNKGKAPARNVQIEFPEGNNMIPHSDLANKFPMERLEQHESVDLVAAVSMNTPPKQTVVVSWEDDTSERSGKTVYLTL